MLANMLATVGWRCRLEEPGLRICNRRCCLIAAICAQFPVEFANPAQAVLQLCQYSANIAGQCQAQQKSLYNRQLLCFPATLLFD